MWNLFSVTFLSLSVHRSWKYHKSNLQGDRETCECYTPEERACKKWLFHTIKKMLLLFTENNMKELQGRLTWYSSLFYLPSIPYLIGEFYTQHICVLQDHNPEKFNPKQRELKTSLAFNTIREKLCYNAVFIYFYPNANWLKKLNTISSANQIKRQSFAALSIGWTDSICPMLDSIECLRHVNIGALSAPFLSNREPITL